MTRRASDAGMFAATPAIFPFSTATSNVPRTFCAGSITVPPFSSRSYMREPPPVSARLPGEYTLRLDPFKPRLLARRVRSAVAEDVRKQAESGLDSGNDGELSKPSFTTYVRE